MRWRLAATWIVLFSYAGPLVAASSGPRPTAPAQPSPQQQALEHYNRGLEHQQRAWEYEKKAAEGKDQEKNLKKARQEYEKALARHLEATRLHPQFPEAFNGLGYAYRKTGDYPEALKAYDQALALNPEYAEAVEYRGEAYLGLNRVEEAQQAYAWLFVRQPGLAQTLLGAVKKWVEARGQDPAGVTPEQLEKARSWAAQQEAEAQELSGSKETGKQEW